MIKGQSSLEFGLLIIVVALIFATMGLYLRRSIQATMHNVQSQLNQPTTSVSTTINLNPASVPACVDPTPCGVYPACYAYDCNKVCNGPAVYDCNGVCNGGAKVGCDNVCGSGKVYDSCWVCGGDGSTCLP